MSPRPSILIIDPSSATRQCFSKVRMNIRASLTELCDAFAAHDLDRIMSLSADDCVLEMPRGSSPFGTRFEGKRKVREGLAA